MRSTIPVRIMRVWPLSLSLVALLTFAYFSPIFYEAFLYSFAGSHTVGWYSDFGPDYGPDGRPYFFYAYKVNGVIYGGRGLYDDENSGIYYRRAGDPVGLNYLKQKPWISTIKPVEWNFRLSRMAIVILSVSFTFGVWLSVSRRRVREPHNQPALISHD